MSASSRSKWAVVLLVAVACGGSSLPDGRIEVLSAEEVNARIERWKANPEKSCTASDVLKAEGAELKGTLYFDRAMLLEKLGGNPRLAGEGGQFAYLKLGPSFVGGASKVEQSNTAGRAFVLEASIAGSHCEVSVDGVKVAEADVVASLDVLAYWDPSQPRNDLGHFSYPELEDGAAGLASLSSHGFHAALEKALEPGEAAVGFVASKLGVSDAMRGKITAIRNPNLDAAWFPQTFEGAPPFASRPHTFSATPPNLFAQRARLATHLSQAETNTFEARVVSPHVRGSLDDGLWALEVAVASEKLADGVVYKVASIKEKPNVPYSNADASACFRARLGVLRRYELRASSAFIDPPRIAVASPCHLLTKDLNAALLEDVEALRSIGIQFNGIAPPVTNDQGWAAMLAELFARTAAAPMATASLEEQLTSRFISAPENQPVLVSAVRSAGRIHSAVATRETLRPQEAALFLMGVRWALEGHNVSDASLNGILDAVVRTMGPFPTSTEKWLDAVGANPAGHEATIAFANAISDDYVGAVGRVVDGAKALGLSSWASDFRANVLQQRPTLEDLTSLERTVGAAQSFLTREKARGNDDRVENVLTTALKERWTEDAFVSLEKIAGYARLQSFCMGRRTASDAVICASSVQLVSTAEGALLATGREGRYGRLAEKFAEHNAALAGTFEQRDLQTAFFRPVWRKCDNGRFDEKAAQVGTIVPRLKAATGLNRSDIARELTEALRDCP